MTQSTPNAAKDIRLVIDEQDSWLHRFCITCSFFNFCKLRKISGREISLFEGKPRVGAIGAIASLNRDRCGVSTTP